MKPNFALDFTHDGISLLHRASGGWRLVGSVALDDPQMADHLKALRQTAESLGDGKVTSKLIIPDSQILYTTVEAPGPDDVAREVQIRVALEGLTPYAVSELVFDWRAEGEVARVAVLAQDTMEEAEGFASQFGFNPVSFVARPERGQFSGEPFFGKTGAAASILGANERVSPDATPVPRNPRPADVPGQAPAPEAPKTAPRPEADPLSAFPPDPTGTDSAEDAAPTAEAAATPKPAKSKGETTPRKAPAPTGSGPMLAPFPPTPEEPRDATTKSTLQPVIRNQSAPATVRPAPQAEPAESAPAQTAPATAPVTAPEKPAPSFATRRSPAPQPAAPVAPAPAAPAATPAAAAPHPGFPIERPSEGNAAPVVVAPAPETGVQGTPKPAPSAKPLVLDDLAPPRTLAGEAEDRRRAMARALGHTDPPAASGPGRASRLASGVASGASAGLARLIGGARALLARARPSERPAQDPVTDGTPAAAKPARQKTPREKPTKPPRGDKTAGFLTRKKPTDPEIDARTREAEAMTVFGARKSQSPPRSRPRYLGLILTLVLLLLMAAAAIWSTVFLDDEVTLFNPDPAETPANAGAPAQTAETPATDAAPDLPTGTVLSPEEAEAEYAVTGVYQRAPDALGDPGAARSDDIYVASIDPTVDPSDALALPEPDISSEAPATAPVPPPPPGTTFDLNEQGLVVATPEGAISPTGVVVYRGRPTLVPAPRPDGLVPEDTPQDDAALDLPADSPDTRPRNRPDDLIELTERAQLGGQSLEELAALRPRARPEGLDTTLPADTPEAESDTRSAEAEQALDEADLENVTDLAVASSVRPGTRPSNFTQVVAQARARAAAQPQANADHSDGSQVVAAAARSNQPIIPSSASVARQATMQNALNLNRVNLIGVYGSKSSRRALVRMGTGRYVKVSVGDRLDGGKVTSISETRLTYQKGNRQMVLDVLPLG